MKALKSNLHLIAPLLVAIVLLACAQNTPDAVFNRGLRAYQEGDFLGASIYFEEFIDKFPEDERVLEAHASLADCFMRTKDFASARAVFEDMKEKFDNPHVHYSADIRIGQTYFQEGYMDKAVEKFNEVASATDNVRYQLEAYRWLGRTYQQQTQTENAINAYDQIQTIANEKVEDPTETLYLKLESIASKASVYQASDQFDTARRLHLSVLDLVNDATGMANIEKIRENAVLSWAQTYVAAGDFVSAATIYDRLQENPNIQEESKPQLIQNKLNSLYNLFLETEEDEFTPEERAILVKEWKRITENFPNTDHSIGAHVQIAQLVQDSTPEMFEEHLQNAVDKLDHYIEEPDSPQRPIQAMINKAQIYTRFQKFDQAKQTLERLMQTYSQVPQAVQQAEGMLNYIKRAEAQAQQQEEEVESVNPPNNMGMDLPKNQ